MKNLKRLGFLALILAAFICTGCASKKGEIVEIDDETFNPKIVLVASGTQRLVRLSVAKSELLMDMDEKAVSAITLDMKLYSGRKPADGAEQTKTPVATVSFDILKNPETLVKGYDLMANEKELKLSADEIDSALSKDQYYYAEGKLEITVKDGKLVTKTKTIYSNDTVYTPLEK